MKIKVTFGEVLEAGSWEEFCDMKGYNPWCINEGLADKSETVELTAEEAKDLGLIDNE